MPEWRDVDISVEPLRLTGCTCLKLAGRGSPDRDQLQIGQPRQTNACKCPYLAAISGQQVQRGANLMNNIIWLVGAVVIVLFILGYFGLR